MSNEELENRNLELEKELLLYKKSEENLKKLNATKDKLFSIIAHDLRSPFNSLMGFANLLLKNIHKYDIDKIEKQIIIIEQTLKKTYNLLEELLMWSNAQTGNLPFNPEEIRLNMICSDILKNIIEIGKNKNITIELKINDEYIIYADRNLIKAIIQHLIMNAIKFTGKGGYVKINAEKNYSNLVISISDNGVGMSEEIIHRLFDNSQIHFSLGTNGEKGTGLGLIICKGCIEKQGGNIWIESELGKGSTIKFSIPIYPQ